eukprot:TRINITY_DN6639_c0_g1_i3.p1 TRINITY_DN6639_c0_g1~~TRINITY_DN6639_c0_g1_i3.p1  ORF type:complete len:347 (-),score=86.35 TRINITY_DN6639_c0_g1_i3:693-1733(-)
MSNPNRLSRPLPSAPSTGGRQKSMVMTPELAPGLPPRNGPSPTAPASPTPQRKGSMSGSPQASSPPLQAPPPSPTGSTEKLPPLPQLAGDKQGNLQLPMRTAPIQQQQQEDKKEKGLFSFVSNLFGPKQDSISTPYNLQHHIHVDFNARTGFVGLPPEWENWILTNNIAKEEVMNNPTEVLNCLETFSNQKEKQQQKDEANTLGIIDVTQPLPEDHPTSIQDLVARGDPTEIFTEIKKIGEGAAGEIFLASHNVTKRNVAIKRMTLTPQNMRLVTTEIAIMKSSHHPHIVEYIDSYLVKDRLWVVMEFMSGGCLTEILDQFEKVKLKEDQIALVRHSAVQIAPHRR